MIYRYIGLHTEKNQQKDWTIQRKLLPAFYELISQKNVLRRNKSTNISIVVHPNNKNCDVG